MLPAFFIRSRGVMKLYNGLFVPVLEKYQLTQLEIDILLFLANNPPFDTARDIVEKRHLAKSHVSAGVESLASRGAVGAFQAGGQPEDDSLEDYGEGCAYCGGGAGGSDAVW